MQKLQFLCSRIHHSDPRISILGASALKSLWYRNAECKSWPHVEPWSQNKAATINRGGVPWIKPGQNRRWLVLENRFLSAFFIFLQGAASTSLRIIIKKDLQVTPVLSMSWGDVNTRLQHVKKFKRLLSYCWSRKRFIQPSSSRRLIDATVLCFISISISVSVRWWISTDINN